MRICSRAAKGSDGKKHFEVTAKWRARSGVGGLEAGGGGTRVQDHNSSRSNKSSSIAAPGGGGGGGGSGYTPVNLINPIAMDKGLRFRTLPDSPKSILGIIR